MTAITFRLTDRDHLTLGWALLCPEARYASIWWTGATRIDRRHLPNWGSVDREVLERLPAGDLPRGSAIAQLFAGDRDLAVRYMMNVPIEATPLTAATALDARLQLLALESAGGAVS